MDNHEHEDTRHRLVNAAGEVFAERGFRHATVREICQRARANVAAVNYHFRDKEGLYAEVLKDAHQAAHDKYPPTLGLGDNPTPAERLHAFVRSFLLRLFDPGRPAWHGLLMVREMTEPTAALDALIEESLRPRYELLLAIMHDLLGTEADEERVRLSANSLVGQCLYYRHACYVLRRLQPQRQYGPNEVERLAEHITQFTIGGLRHLAGASRGATDQRSVPQADLLGVIKGKA
jgi:AcrR family transcriptional regulator